MAQVITLAGERLFALKAQNNQQLDIDTFIFAYVPGQDSTAPIDRNEDLPPVNQRVHTQIVQQYGMLEDNAVVYSTVLNSLTGPFQFNWVGLYSAVNQTLVAIQHIPTVVKTVTEPGAAGNTLNRNLTIEYSGISDLTGITVAPETWQYDFEARLNGMDELTRQLAADMNGKDWFIGDGFKVVPRSTLNTFKVTAGVGYVSGLRVELTADHILALSSYPQFVYVDAWFDGTSESIWKGHVAFTVTNTEMDDYIDVNGRNHYVFKLARITAADVVEDFRNVNGLGQKIKKALITSTVDEVSSGVFDTGTYVYLSERGNAAALVQSGSDANGETILNAGDGKIAVVDEAFLSRAETYSSIQAAANNAKSLGIKVLNVDSYIDSSDNIQNKGSVALIGNGKLNGVYRKRVARSTDPTSISFNDLSPSKHLARFIKNSSPVVVMVGDSLGTDDGGDIPKSATLYARLKKKLSDAYPEKDIAFYNRSIGGETYFTAVGLPFSYPEWYTNKEIGWPSYVGSLNPDLVIFNFGMNDSIGFKSSVLELYQSYFDNLGIFPAGRPDVIYCTNLTPSIDSPISDFGTKEGQSGRDFVAGYTRSYAKSIGAGLLDFHRQCTVVKDGYDPCDTSLKLIGNIEPVNGAVTAFIECTDFKWDLELSIAEGSNFAVKLGYQETWDSSGRGAFVVIGNKEGYFYADFYDTPNNIYKGLESIVAVPTGLFQLSVEKKQNSIVISNNGNVIFSFNNARVHGKDFYPRCGDATYSNGTIVKAVFYAGEYKTYKQSVINDDMWGESNYFVETKKPFGGNGANHPSTLGASAVYQPVIDNCQFSHDGTVIKSEKIRFLNGWSQQPGFSESIATRIDNNVTIQFTMVAPSEGAVGIAFSVSEYFRPSPGLSSFAIMMQPNGESSIGNIGPDGSFQVYSGINGYCWGLITYSV